MGKVKGEIGRDQNGNIYYQHGSEVYRATKDAIADCRTGYLIGRWETSVAHFNRYYDGVFSKYVVLTD